MFGSFGYKKKPRNPLGNDIMRIVGCVFMIGISLFAKMWLCALLFLGLAIFWAWHYIHTKKKFEDAVKKREEFLSSQYGYDDDGSEDDGGEYF
jgi:hypothetical protein